MFKFRPKKIIAIPMLLLFGILVCYLAIVVFRVGVSTKACLYSIDVYFQNDVDFDEAKVLLEKKGLKINTTEFSDHAYSQTWELSPEDRDMTVKVINIVTPVSDIESRLELPTIRRRQSRILNSLSSVNEIDKIREANFCAE